MSSFSAIITALWQKFGDPFRKLEDRGLDTKSQQAAGTDRTAGPLTISQEAYQLILEFETGGAEYYAERLERPSWPGGASGLTIGIGYDLGYNTPSEIHHDWNCRLPAHVVEQLARYSGVKGVKAKDLVKSAKHIRVPWNEATAVYQSRTLPRFGKQAVEAFPNLPECHPHVQGALLSLVFNRGPALTGKNRQDMMDIHRILADGVQAGDYAKIADQLRDMKVIWQGQGLDGLLRRREAEARLIESIPN